MLLLLYFLWIHFELLKSVGIVKGKLLIFGMLKLFESEPRNVDVVVIDKDMFAYFACLFVCFVLFVFFKCSVTNKWR